mmetsp:Transcript_70091/g.111245  ORF Transcript_70091/g.111245 Transcript_70091/m.111245 type:complete len:103 (+) Transcript_70091:1357-1665(+)
MRISRNSFDLEDAIFDTKETNITSATTKIEYHNMSLPNTCFVQAVSDSRGSWLIYYTKYIQTRNRTSILGGLALSIVEMGWDCDDSIFDFLAKVSLGDVSHF